MSFVNRSLLVGLLLLLAFVAGCIDGRQKGKFAVSGSSFRALANYPGSFIELRGRALADDDQPTGASKPLMYILVVCPGLQSSGSGSEAADDSYQSTHRIVWRAQPKDVAIEFTWNRAEDTVQIHGSHYRRTEGNIFVVIREKNGNISTWQVQNIDASADVNDVLHHIREQLPDVPILADLNLTEISPQSSPREEYKQSDAMRFDVFYTCYSTDQTVPSQAPIEMSVLEIQEAFRQHLRGADDFLGLVDSAGVTLQFAMDENGAYWTEIPHPERRGSAGRTLSANEAAQLLQQLPSSLSQLEDRLDLKFQSW